MKTAADVKYAEMMTETLNHHKRHVIISRRAGKMSKKYARKMWNMFHEVYSI